MAQIIRADFKQLRKEREAAQAEDIGETAKQEARVSCAQTVSYLNSKGFNTMACIHVVERDGRRFLAFDSNNDDVQSLKEVEREVHNYLANRIEAAEDAE